MKVTVIEEARELSSNNIDEPIGSLKTFEISINDISEKKNKGITFVSNYEGDHGYKEKGTAGDIGLHGNKSNKSLKNLDRKWKANVQDKRVQHQFQEHMQRDSIL